MPGSEVGSRGSSSTNNAPGDQGRQGQGQGPAASSSSTAGDATAATAATSATAARRQAAQQLFYDDLCAARMMFATGGGLASPSRPHHPGAGAGAGAEPGGGGGGRASVTGAEGGEDEGGAATAAAAPGQQASQQLRAGLGGGPGPAFVRVAKGTEIGTLSFLAVLVQCSVQLRAPGCLHVLLHRWVGGVGRGACMCCCTGGWVGGRVEGGSAAQGGVCACVRACVCEREGEGSLPMCSVLLHRCVWSRGCLHREVGGACIGWQGPGR